MNPSIILTAAPLTFNLLLHVALSLCTYMYYVYVLLVFEMRATAKQKINIEDVES